MRSTSSNSPLWDVGDGLALPELHGEQCADVCVVGLGGSGLVCALELAKLGARVTGIDAREVGGGAGGRNGGFLLAGLASFYHDAVVTHGRERAKAIYQRSLDEIDRIESDTPGLVSRPGSLRIAESDEEADDCEAHVDALQADGFAADQYAGPEGIGLLIPRDGAFQPLYRCRALAASSIALGAILFEHSPALDIGAGVVRTPNGVIRAKTIVVAVDGRLSYLIPELAPELRTARLQMLATAPTSEIRLTRPVYARWGYDYWQQRPDGSIALGGARDVGGDAEWTTDTSTTDVVQSALQHRLRNVMHVNALVTHRWAASVSYTRNELPIVREVRPSVWAIGGYSGTGNVIGSLLGRGIARMLVRGDRSLIVPLLS